MLKYKKTYVNDEIIEIFKVEECGYKINVNGNSISFCGKNIFSKDDLARMVIFLEENVTFSSIYKGNGNMHYIGFSILESNILDGYTFINISNEILSKEAIDMGMVKYEFYNNNIIDIEEE